MSKTFKLIIVICIALSFIFTAILYYFYFYQEPLNAVDLGIGSMLNYESIQSITVQTEPRVTYTVTEEAKINTILDEFDGIVYTRTQSLSTVGGSFFDLTIVTDKNTYYFSVQPYKISYNDKLYKTNNDLFTGLLEIVDA